MAEPTNWTELKTNLADWLDRTDLTVQIPEFIGYAERHFNRTAFAPDRESALSLSATSQSTALPTDFWGFKSPPYIDAATDVVLQKLTPDELRATYPTTSTGTPSHYAIEGENILVGPTPSSTQTIKGTYYKTIPQLGSGQATNWLLTDHPDIYMAGSLHYAHLFLADEQRADLWGGHMERLVGELNRSGRTRANSGPMTATHSVQNIPNIQA